MRLANALVVGERPGMGGWSKGGMQTVSEVVRCQLLLLLYVMRLS